jgi:dihydrodipicolinate synthase/N-acetylneuraminate lyase
MTHNDGSAASTNVTGLVPPIATPFRDGRIDEESLRRQLDDLHDHVSGVLVGGSVGEISSLTIEERLELMRLVADHWSRDKFLVVSIADNCIENSRRLSAVAGEVGADLLMVSAPNYFENDRPMLEAYFGAVAEFASANLCLYDNPIATNTLLSVDDIAALDATIPRLTHVKVTDTSVPKVAELRQRTSLVVFAGDDSVLWHQLNRGVEGAMVALPMIYPAETARIWAEFTSGNLEQAYESYRPVSHFIHCAFGASDYVAVTKAVLHHRGIIAAPEVRPPLLNLTDVRRKEAMDALAGSASVGLV